MVMPEYHKVKIYDRYLVGLGPREASVVRLEEGETSVTEVTLSPLHRAVNVMPSPKYFSGLEATICFKFLSSS